MKKIRYFLKYFCFILFTFTLSGCGSNDKAEIKQIFEDRFMRNFDQGYITDSPNLTLTDMYGAHGNLSYDDITMFFEVFSSNKTGALKLLFNNILDSFGYLLFWPFLALVMIIWVRRDEKSKKA